MSILRNKKEIINYLPDKLRSFIPFRYEWIDNLNFTIAPEECLENAADYITIVKEMLLEAGWEGDGQIELMWIPPFMLKREPNLGFADGITIWHVKQLEDGTSWLLSPIKLPYCD